ncbi:TonB-dependent receptor [Terracidiphilus gabretensis]|uniref:TonB-dependent receptor n=1 Tax=Terracidiphilus gabretensis TaxID=1577687 RepID=UPI00071BF73E|nr:TonB-dependent receptor [Terracidiphilus gabretensis]
MRFIKLQGAALALSLLTFAGLAMVVSAPVAHAQTAVTGAISGVVADASGAVVPNATVTIINTGTNAKQVITTNAEGRYTASQLSPGTYKVSATSAGLQSETTVITVLVGTTLPADIKVTPTADKTIVEVSATTLPLVDTQNVALATTFNEEQIQALPTPGGDVTTVAFTLPGVVVNVGGSYGNFSSDGLPGISNLFVLNGFDNQDPFLNLNNSGSSNLTLGQGELAEATVVQNGYNSQYGRAAGATINYTTKSGTNKFHGMADYNWNGTALNANGWFNQYDNLVSGLPSDRPHAVSNEWAANVGGPIVRDKVFFFADYEGLRYVLPGSSGFLTFPSPEMASYIQSNVPAAAQSLYALALASFKKSPAYANAQPVTNGSASNQDGNGALGCGLADAGGMQGTPAPGGGTFGVDTPCMLVGTGTANNINKEWLFTGRGDWNISDKHKIYGRYKMDRGSQPTSTSFVDPLFSALSIQPEYEGQFNDSYVFSNTKTNSLTVAANWYTAYFGPANPAASLAELPVNFYYTDAGVDGSGVNAAPGLPSLGVPFYLTQGRNVTQYQISDDYSWIVGKNTLKFGANFRRDLVSDYDSQEAVVFPYAILYGLGDFASGDLTNAPYHGNDQYNQAYTATNTAHLALYNLGVYFQDEWQASPKLKLTIGARIDRTGNPLCHDGCFSRYVGSFPASGVTADTPYNHAEGGQIQAQSWNAFPSVQAFNFQPRFGFNYSIDEKTEVRGGVGWFSDLYPAGFIDGVIQNFPNYNLITTFDGALNTTGTGTSGAFTTAGNAAILQGFGSGSGLTQIENSLSAQGIPFVPPAMGATFPGQFNVPEYVEYSLQVQRQLDRSTAVILTYAGNYGYDGVLINPYLNATNSRSLATASTQLDPRFERVQAYTNDSHSNYNGLMVQLKHNSHGFTGQISYTYSHALDMVSNGGEGEYFNSGAVTNQLTPSLGAGNLNYSNADYDIRNNLVGDLVYTEPHIRGHKFVDAVAGGWTLGGKTYYRSGEPFNVTNGALLSGFPNLGSTLMADSTVPTRQITNISGSDPHKCVTGSCFDPSQFVVFGNQADFGNIRRNSLFGPHYVNSDLNLMKKLVNFERFNFQLGINAYNIFNHANFASPTSDVSSGAFGIISSTVAPPTSPYGSFQGAAVTQRLFVLHGKFVF